MKFLFEEPIEADWQEIDQGKAVTVLEALEKDLKNISWEEAAIRQGIKDLSYGLKIKGKELFMPIRLALTGSHAGPELYKIIYLFGRGKSLQRLGKSVAALKG